MMWCPWKNSGQLLQTALLGNYKSAPISISDEARALIRHFTEEEEIPVPNGVNAELRPYQKRGYSWLYRDMQIGFGSILADDMGLGKILQTITLLQKLTSFIYHGTDRKMPKIMPDVLLTSHGVLRSDANIFAKKHWSVMIIDEAQNIYCR